MAAYQKSYYARKKAEDPDRFWEYQLRSRYGLTREDYSILLAAQGGGCAICAAKDNSGSRFVVDHDHKTGAVRGLLCRGCNLALGAVLDNPNRLERAAAYLRDAASLAPREAS